METNSGINNQGDVSAAEAREILDQVNNDSHNISAQINSPWWYHLGLGLAVGFVVAAQAFGDTAVMISMAVLPIAIALAIWQYRRKVGVWGQNSATGGWELVVAIVMVPAGITAALFIKSFDISPWWALIPAAAVCAATVLAGRAADAKMRRRVAKAVA